LYRDSKKCKVTEQDALPVNEASSSAKDVFDIETFLETQKIEEEAVAKRKQGDTLDEKAIAPKEITEVKEEDKASHAEIAPVDEKASHAEIAPVDEKASHAEIAPVDEKQAAEEQPMDEDEEEGPLQNIPPSATHSVFVTGRIIVTVVTDEDIFPIKRSLPAAALSVSP
jgi:hypothetical protein